RVDHAGHDGRAGAVHHLVARFGRGAAAGPHALDAVTADHHVTGPGWCAGPVEDLPVDEQDPVLGHSCDPRMWRRWDTAAGHWDTLPGAGELLIARGLGDIRLRLPVPPSGG